MDIITIAICAVIAGASNWKQIEAFGRQRERWLRRFLALANGIPAHDTFQRVFARLDPVAFQVCFRDWLINLADAVDIKQIAIDGKTVRASRTEPLGPLHLVSAWATENHLSLGQVAVDAESNEIPAIPKLLELLELKGALVTLDAGGCHKEIAEKIRSQGGHYVLTVKGNQPQLLEDIKEMFARAFASDFAGLDADFHADEDKRHGREEERACAIIRNAKGLRNQEAWKDLCVVGMVQSERRVQGKVQREVRYFIGSKKACAGFYARAMRHHWRIENNLHWQMDVTFAEDKDRTKERTAAQNISLLRRVALTLLKHHPDKQSIACKRLQAAWNTDFLEEVLLGSAKLAKM
ncbi:MAG: putative transposase YncI [Gemmatales bacterium]|nr:MAG: putative transposase YncI [Gemmatales bacterium]